MSPARRTAFDVLLKTHQGGYSSDLLLAQSVALDTRDAGLASEIVFGCLRFQTQIDHLIDRLCRGSRLDIEVRVALRMGVYQLRYLDRVPAHAAVDESVELIKRARKRSAAGLVNAILRKIDRKPVAWPDRATELSCPEWLLESWERQFGERCAEVIAHAALQPAQSFTASTGRTQDIGAQGIVPLLEIQPGDTFLDLCAAPGNKTAQALALGARAVACDLYGKRLQSLGDLECARVVLDATHPLPFHAKFDRILVDAPCSGTGTLGRNPEIKWRLQPMDLAVFHERQTAILKNALEHLAPGGRLVYATCSLEDEENEQVIRRFPLEWRIWRNIPGVDEGDGFFAAVLQSG